MSQLVNLKAYEKKGTLNVLNVVQRFVFQWIPWVWLVGSPESAESRSSLRARKRRVQRDAFTLLWPLQMVNESSWNCGDLGEIYVSNRFFCNKMEFFVAFISMIWFIFYQFIMNLGFSNRLVTTDMDQMGISWWDQKHSKVAHLLHQIHETVFRGHPILPGNQCDTKKKMFGCLESEPGIFEFFQRTWRKNEKNNNNPKKNESWPLWECTFSYFSF